MPIIRRRGASPDKIARRVRANLDAIIDEETDEIVREAKQIVPVRTGALKAVNSQERTIRGARHPGTCQCRRHRQDGLHRHALRASD